MGPLRRRPHRALALLARDVIDQTHQPPAEKIERRVLLAGLIHEYRAARRVNPFLETLRMPTPFVVREAGPFTA
jgi:hypothetical protein